MFKLQPKQPTQPPLLPNPTTPILYLHHNPSTNTLTTLSLSSPSPPSLQPHPCSATIRQTSITETIEISFKIDRNQIQGRHVLYVFVQGGDGFVVVGGKLGVGFVAKGEKELVWLRLKDDVGFGNAVIDLVYPNLVIYGKKDGESKSCVYELNMDTLQFKTVNDGSGYSPGIRSQQLSVINDGRIYVFGGKSKSNKPVDKMIYVYDLQKGYWFALQMQYPSQHNYSQFQVIPLSSSRVLLINGQGDRAWVLEIHQSRLTQVEGFQGQEGKEGKGRSACVMGEMVRYGEMGWEYWAKEICYYKK